jgi:hypothetical protein
MGGNTNGTLEVTPAPGDYFVGDSAPHRGREINSGAAYTASEFVT